MPEISAVLQWEWQNVICDFSENCFTALEAFFPPKKGRFPFYLPSYLPASFVQVGLPEEGGGSECLSGLELEGCFMQLIRWLHCA